MIKILSSSDSCPPGFAFLSGDVPGCGTISNDPTITDIASCAEKCAGDPTCCSFEFSPTAKKCNCNLNSECSPTLPANKDYAFCVKGNIIFLRDHLALEVQQAHLGQAVTSKWQLCFLPKGGVKNPKVGKVRRTSRLFTTSQP